MAAAPGRPEDPGPLRVLMLIPYDLKTQPFTIRTRAFARELVKRGHAVRILYEEQRRTGLRNWGTIVHAELPSGCEVHLHPRMWRPRDWAFMASAVRQADVVHFQKSFPRCAGTALIFGRSLGKPLHQDWDDSMEAYCLQQAHDVWEGGGPTTERYLRTVRALLGAVVLGTAERLIPRLVETVGAASMDLRRKSADWGCKPEDLFPAPVGVDSDDFCPERRDVELRKRLRLTGPAVLFAGSFDVHPDLIFFAKAVRALFEHSRDAQCLIVGGGPGREHLRGVLEHELSTGRVVMTDGLVPFAEMPRFVASCDVAALPFRDTPVNRSKSSLTLLESMASGVPCVTHDVGDIGWMLGEGGVLAGGTDPETFGRILAELARDPARREDLGRRARARARDRFSWAASVDYLEAAYRRGLAKRRPPAPGPRWGQI